MITLYDLAAKEPTKNWSLNVWKVRYVLNLKNLPYKTVYLEFPDIKTVLQQTGVPPSVKRDGSLRYTVPSIMDNATGMGVSDSFEIAQYLDKQYPDTPQAFPSGSLALQTAFNTQFGQLTRPLAPLMLPKIPNVLSPAASEHFRNNFADVLAAPTEEELERLWIKAKEVFDLLDGFYAKSGGPFFMGETPSFVDFILGGVFHETKALDQADWERYIGWHGGRWARLVKDLEKYASTEN